MSLIVNGVTIPETNGAIKVGATNVQKVVVNGTTVWEVPQGYIISWSMPLSQYGSFINNPLPPDSTGFNYGGKQIRYTKPDGSIAVANPYNPGSITIKKGTVVYLDMFTGAASTKSYIRWYKDGREYDFDSGTRGTYHKIGYIPTSNGAITKREDSMLNASSGYRYNWGCNFIIA